MTDRISINSRSDIDALEPRKTRYRAWDAQLPGLCIRVAPSGSCTWYYEYRDGSGNRQAVKIGSADQINPGDARRATRCLGLDPAADKRSAKADRAKEDALGKLVKKRTVRAYLENDYGPNHLSTTRTGDASVARIMGTWVELLDKDMATVGLLDIERVRRSRLLAGVSAQTINRDWTALRALLNSARRAGLIQSLPEVRRLKENDAKRIRWLGQRDEVENQAMGERERFLEALENMPSLAGPAHSAIVVAYWTGMRRGEVFALEWRDVDFGRKQITVRAENAKSGKGRHIPLHPRLATYLAELDRTHDLLVPSLATGEKLTQINRSWATLCKRAQVSDFRFHDLRHDFASRLVMNGTDLYVVRDLLGHSSILLTERYAHLSPEQHHAAIEALG